MFELEYSNLSKRFLKNSERKLLLRIFDKLEKLKENPVPSDVKRVEGYKETTFRIRVGKIRILYRINHEKNIILISKIDKREKIYDYSKSKFVEK